MSAKFNDDLDTSEGLAECQSVQHVLIGKMKAISLKTWNQFLPIVNNDLGSINDPYRNILEAAGICDYNIKFVQEKPIILYSTLGDKTEPKLVEIDYQLASWFLHFCSIIYIDKPLEMQLETHIARSYFFEDDYNCFSLATFSPPFNT